MRTVDINQTELVGLSLSTNPPGSLRREAASDAVVKVRTSISPKWQSRLQGSESRKSLHLNVSPPYTKTPTS
jgi:hypothetical protein